MFIEPATSKRFLLAPAERNLKYFRFLLENVALRWSADHEFMVESINIRLLRSQPVTVAV